MNYLEHYNKLIERAKERTLVEYKEVHHIIPKCMGGSDDKDNLVELTAREHFIAHLLLLKIHPNQYGLIKALNMMCVQSLEHNNNRSMNRMYGWLKEKFSKEMSQSQSGVGNSQHGTMWIHNLELKESKKIPKSDNIPEGWLKGRVLDFNKLVEKQNEKELAKKLKEEQKQQKQNEKELAKKLKEEQKQQKQNEKIKLYTEWYKIYDEVGFKEFVNITGYEYTLESVVYQFKKYVKEYKPQNGKKRGR